MRPMLQAVAETRVTGGGFVHFITVSTETMSQEGLSEMSLGARPGSAAAPSGAKPDGFDMMPVHSTARSIGMVTAQWHCTWSVPGIRDKPFSCNDHNDILSVRAELGKTSPRSSRGNKETDVVNQSRSTFQAMRHRLAGRVIVCIRRRISGSVTSIEEQPEEPRKSAPFRCQ